MTNLRILRSLAIAAAIAALAFAAGAGDAPETVRWASSVGEVVFPHALHAEAMEIECASCHHGTAALALEVPHPDYFDDFWVDCSTCHTGREASADAHDCATCHPQKPTRAAVEMPSVKVAIHRSCWSCHEQENGAAASAGCAFCHRRERGASAPAGGAR